MKKQLLSVLITIIYLDATAQTIPNYVPTNGLVSWYPFNGNANDESGNGNHGTVNGPIVTTDRFGVNSKAYSFFSCNEIHANINTSSITSGMTLSFWFYRNAIGCIGPRVMEFSPGSNSPGQLIIEENYPSGVRLSEYTSGGFNIGGWLNFSALVNQTWSNYVYTNDGTFQKLYQNGVLINTYSSPGNSVLNGDVAFGRMNHPAYDGIDGKLDDIGIWNGALTQQEISDLYQPNITPPSSFCFNTANYYNVNTNPVGITSGDFNGDGNKDLAVTNNLSNNVSILLGDIAGNFSPATNYTLTSNPAEIITADFNGDSNLDLAVTGGINNVWILLGNGSGTFSIATSFSASLYPGSLCASDFNGDGDLDLAVANGNSANSISILIGNGVGGFSPATDYPVGTCPCGLSCIKAGDFNNDSKVDLAIANQNSNDVSVIIGNGLGSFGSPASFAVGSSPWSVVLNDFNGDTFLDVATSNQNSNNVSLLLGDGAGNLGIASNFSVGLKPEMLVCADFDGDTKTDIATCDRNSNTISVIAGDGLGGFAPPTSFVSTSEPFALCVNDFNNDSKMDIATANFSSNNVSVLLNCNTLVGILKNDFENSFTVYPNPTSDLVNINSFSKIALQKYIVLDCLGRQVLNGQFSIENSTINLNGLAKGIYFIRLNDNRSIKVLKK